MGQAYESCRTSPDGSPLACSQALVPIPQAAIPLALAVVAAWGVIARQFKAAWPSLVALVIFGFLGGFSIGAPIFVAGLATIPFVALYQSPRAARVTAAALSLLTAAVGGLIVAVTLGASGGISGSDSASAYTATVLGVGPLALGLLVAFGVARGVRVVAWFGVALLTVLLVLFLPYSIIYLVSPIAIALLLPSALSERATA